MYFFSDWLLDKFILVIWETNVSVHFCVPLLFTFLFSFPFHSSSKKRKERQNVSLSLTSFFLSLHGGDAAPPLSSTGDGESDGE